MKRRNKRVSQERVDELREMYLKGVLGEYVRTELLGIGKYDYALGGQDNHNIPRDYEEERYRDSG